jgi:hypothetical protein
MDTKVKLTPTTLLLTVALSGVTSLAAPMTASPSIDGDYLVRYYLSYLRFVDHLQPDLFWTFARTAFILLFASVLCGFLLAHIGDKVAPVLLVPLFWVTSLLATLASLELPIPRCTMSPGLKGLLFALAVAGLAVLPWRLTFYLVPKAGPRKIAAGVLWAVITFTFFVHPKTP